MSDSADFLKIGSLHLRNRFLLAPLTKISDLPFRLVVKQYGPALSFTEMIDAGSLAKDKKNTIGRIKTANGHEFPIGLQMFGTRPEDFAKSIERYGHSFDVFDLNLGCPTDEAVSQGAGVALLRRPQRVKSLVESMRKATSKPISVKIRLGIDNSKQAVKMAQLIEESGADVLVVHGRTAEQPYSHPADWNAVRTIKNALDIPVIGNGDVFDSRTAHQFLDEKFSDGIMLGRAAIQNPKIFAECLYPDTQPATFEERVRWIMQYGEFARQYGCFSFERFRRRVADFLYPYLQEGTRKILRTSPSIDSKRAIYALINTLYPKTFPLEDNGLVDVH